MILGHRLMNAGKVIGHKLGSAGKMIGHKVLPAAVNGLNNALVVANTANKVKNLLTRGR